MNLNFSVNILSVFIALSVATLLILIIEKFFTLYYRSLPGYSQVKFKRSQLADCARVVFPLLIILLLLRAFVIQNFRVQTTSMEPTLQSGDFTLINQFFYGVHLPLNHALIFPKHAPKRGQLVVLYWPVNPAVHVMKRVIGLPGDRISYLHHHLYINGQAVPTIPVSQQESLQIWSETLGGRTYHIQVNPKAPALDFAGVVVPAHEYFVMNDNREDTEDSRSFGFVPRSAFEGEVFMVWMSWDQYTHHIRWYRVGKRV